MYNNQPQYGARPQPQRTQGGQGQFEKNPNGGYLNPSNYGNDSWYGTVDITPQLLAEIQRSGKALIEVKDAQTTQYGPCRRVVVKPYTPKQDQGPAQGGYGQQVPNNYGHSAAPQGYAPPPNQGYASPPANPGYAPGPVHHSPAPVNHGAPHGGQFIEDDIPF